MRTSPLQRPAMKTLLIHGAALVMQAWCATRHAGMVCYPSCRHGALPVTHAWCATRHACMVRYPSCMHGALPVMQAWCATRHAGMVRYPSCMHVSRHPWYSPRHACILHAAHVPLSISPCMLPACLPTSFPPCYPAPMPLSPHKASFPRCSHSSWHSHGVGARSPHGPVQAACIDTASPFMYSCRPPCRPHVCPVQYFILPPLPTVRAGLPWAPRTMSPSSTTCLQCWAWPVSSMHRCEPSHLLAGAAGRMHTAAGEPPHLPAHQIGQQALTLTSIPPPLWPPPCCCTA